MNNNLRILCYVVLFSAGCAVRNGSNAGPEDYTAFVNPFVGTKNMGHTYPGATLPFGMVQVSPQTGIQPFYTSDGTYNKKTYQYCSGYQYCDSTIYGFVHTVFSGTGHSDLGDILIMPVMKNGSGEEPEKLLPAVFSHENEQAEPGYYRVFLEPDGITAECTATERTGFHCFTFQDSGSARINLDLTYNIYNFPGKNVWTFIRVENDSLITGYRQTTGWARTRYVYFAIEFSKRIASYGHHKLNPLPYNGFYRKFNESQDFPEMAGKEILAYFDFKVRQGEKIQVKCALSPTSTAGALKNLRKEVPAWDFESVRNAAKDRWNSELSKIAVKTVQQDEKETFYTALYHTMLSPVLYEDVDGLYRGLDQNNHRSEGFTNYTVFSLWDTYRALHPLFTIVHPQRNRDMVQSMLAHYKQSVHGMLPIWSHYANENWCMIGYHAVSVIADAAVKDMGGIDVQAALEACVSTSTKPYFDGLDSYMKYGYVPDDKSGSSVSKTLEYAYNDWCIAQIARKAGNKDVFSRYMERSQSYTAVFDSAAGFMRPRLSNGRWRRPFDPMDTHGQGFIEGNAWNYGLYVPHNIPHMITMMGGKERFSRRLDSLFSMHIDEQYIEKNEDITRDGIIGTYVHGNEPGHHIPYLYLWSDKPWKTGERVRMIMDRMYSNTPDGLCGNDDAGQMSA